MSGHQHAPDEYCERCRPILQADYGAGEQFWRHWSTPTYVPGPDGRKVRFKILSKRTPLFGRPVIEFACIREFEDRSKESFGIGFFERDDQLLAFVAGIDCALKSMIPGLAFDLTDFRDCDTVEKWEYKMREGTSNFDVWNDPSERPEIGPA